jgi:SMODS-associating 2TM, beta-strand rich effector domain
VALCFEVWDRLLWRLPRLPQLTGRPVLRGTWKGLLESTWVDPKTGKQIEPRDAFLVIRQTFWTLSTRLLTSESSSVSLVSSLDTDRDKVTTVQWTYRNTPQLLLQKRSPIHHGAVILEVHGFPPTRLSGYYQDAASDPKWS